MATRQQQPRAVKDQKQEVLPTAPKEEGFKFGSSNTWGRGQLKVLGVDFALTRRIDLNRVLKVRESEWSPELCASTPTRSKHALICARSRRRCATVVGC